MDNGHKRKGGKMEKTEKEKGNLDAIYQHS